MSAPGEFFTDLRIPPKIRETLTPEPWAPGILTGPPGSGKTWLGCARLLGASVEAGKALGLFVSIPELLHELRRLVGDTAAQDDTLEVVLAAKHLVLDDLGAEKASDWTRDRLYLILNFREMRKLPTVVTTNLDAAGLEAFDARLASRLFALGPMTFLGGRDRRSWSATPRTENVPFLEDRRPAPAPTPIYSTPPTPEEVKRVEKGFAGIYQRLGFSNAAEMAEVFNAAEPEARLMPRGEFNGRLRELVRRAQAGERVEARRELGVANAE